MEKDLDMSGHDYNVALTIFFVSYAGAEPFTNRRGILSQSPSSRAYICAVLLKKVGPRVFFTAVVLTWVSLQGSDEAEMIADSYKGLCMMCMGLVDSYGGLLAARFFLGITEAGLFRTCRATHFYRNRGADIYQLVSTTICPAGTRGLNSD